MAVGCDDCLRSQLGFLSEADYPLDPGLQEPEYVYCVDGAPSLTPHKGMVGVATGVTLWGSTELPAAGTGVEIPPSSEANLSWVNETAYTVSVLVLTSGPLTWIRGAMGGTLGFTYSYDYAVSSPAVSGAFAETIRGVEAGSTTNTNSIQMVSQATFEIAAGGSISIVPNIRYTTTGVGTGRYMAGARMDVMMLGGAS